MSTRIDKIIDDVIEREGPFVDNPDDRGGATCWGITEATARREGYTGAMQDLPRELAAKIYRRSYVERPGFDLVDAISPAIAAELVDTGVNMGQAVAATFLQRCLNVLNNGERFYPDLDVDGAAGHATIDALTKYLAKRGAEGETVMLRALNALQGARYIEITERDESQETFLYGWIRSRVA